LRVTAGAINIDLPAYQIAWPSLIALSFASVVLLCVNLEREHPIHGILTSNPLRIIAKYSYAIYLWHLIAAIPAMAALESLAGRFRWLQGIAYDLTYFALAGGIAFAFAMLSWHIVEQPALNLKDRFFTARG
jgi:peptidoglycan/LPS O-acetylase OafA/YrhL